MSEDLSVQRSQLARHLVELAGVIAELLVKLPHPLHLARRSSLSDGLESMRNGADLLHQLRELTIVEHQALFAMEHWISAALLVHARTHHADPRAVQRSANFNAAVAEDLIGSAIVSLGGVWPPVEQQD